MSGAMGILVQAFREEPGFRGLRVGDVIDLRPVSTERTAKSVVADRMLEGLVDRFGIADTADVRLRFEAAIELSDALATRAFRVDDAGDDRFLRLGQEAAYRLLTPALGEVESAGI
jgi:hypothetical protein